MDGHSNAVEELLSAPAGGRILSKGMEDYAASCRNGAPPVCRRACPLDLDIPAFITKLQRGNFTGAYAILRDAVIFPEIVCRFCPEYCAEVCERRETDRAVSLRRLERAASEHARTTKPTRFHIPGQGKRVAVIGAGLGGLACLFRLVRRGYDAVLYEKEDRIGGSLLERGAPEELIPLLENQLSCIEFEKRTARLSGEEPELADFDAVVAATGGAALTIPSGQEWFRVETAPGDSVTQVIAAGVQTAAAVNRYLLTGKREDASSAEGAPLPGASAGEPSAPPESYTKEEAKEEAGRCRKCDCTECSDACTMMRWYAKMPPRIVSDVRKTFNYAEGLEPRVAVRLVNACSDCDACGSVCPEGIDMGRFLIDARRILHKDRALPPAFHSFYLADMAFADGPECALSYSPPGFSSCSRVFFPGCQLGASDPRYVRAAYEQLLKGRKDTALLLGCCGAPAVWAGREDLVEQKKLALLQQWEAMGRPVFVLACPTCRKMFERYLPEIETISLYRVLDGEMEMRPRAERRAAIFDPCSSGNDPETREAVRRLAAGAGVEAEELFADREKKVCCGFGGNIRPSNESLYRKIAQDCVELSELPYVTYCSNCRETLRSRGKECRHILDVLFDLDDGTRPVPHLGEMRDNRRRLKKELLQTYCAEARRPEEERMHVQISEELLEKMDAELITAEDVETVIRYCEESGRKLASPRNGQSIGHLRIGTATFWVIYRKQDDGFAVENVYSHRMQIEDEEESADGR